MGTSLAGDLLATRFAQLKQQKDNNATLSETVTVFTPSTRPIVIKPSASSWEELEAKLTQVINLPGLWITAKELYEQGFGAELETAADIALATAKKSPLNMFAAMVSKKSGNWATRTLKVVQETWEVRRNALEVMLKLKLKDKSTKAILALAWRLRGSIIRYLALATEQGTGIKNPTGLFFALTKKPKQQPSAA